MTQLALDAVERGVVGNQQTRIVAGVAGGEKILGVQPQFIRLIEKSKIE